MKTYELRYKRQSNNEMTSYHFVATDKEQAEILAYAWLDWENKWQRDFGEKFIFIAIYKD